MRILRPGLLIVLAACGSLPPPEVEPTSPDLVRVERDGIRYYSHREDLDFLETLHPRMMEYRAKAAPTIKRCRAFLKEHLPDPGRPSDYGLDTPLGSRLFNALIRYLDVPESDLPDLRDGWTSLIGMDFLYSGFFNRMLDVLSCDRVRIARFEEIAGDKIRFWSYLPGEDRISVHLRWIRKDGVEVYQDAAGRTVPGDPFYFATVVCRDRTPGGATWQGRMDTMIESLKSMEADVSNAKSRSGEWSLFDRNGHLGAFIALHELAELWVYQQLQIRDPLARWFHDGVANAVAEQIIREEISEEAAQSTPYSARQAPQFGARAASANLLAWARKDIQDHVPLADETACYYAATDEIRKLEERHGKGSLRKLLFRLRELKPVSSEIIWATVKDLWSDDLQARLAGYSPKLPPAVAIRRVAAVNQRRWPEAVSLLRQSAECAPRDLQARYMLVGSLLSQDPERNLQDILFHGRVYLTLAQVTGKQPEMFWAEKYDAKTYWAFGKLAMAVGNPPHAMEFFKLALKEQPDHAPSLEALRELEKPGSK